MEIWKNGNMEIWKYGKKGLHASLQTVLYNMNKL